MSKPPSRPSPPTLPSGAERPESPTSAPDPPCASRFDALYALLSLALLGGLVLDGWAHNHGRVDDPFFTPWHAVVYGSFAWLAVLIVAAIVRRRLPEGYGASAAGVATFLCGGVGDWWWHTRFGVEAAVEASLSPPHILLAIGFVLIVLGPWRAAWRRAPAVRTVGWRALGPALTGLSAGWTIFGFMSQFAHPFVSRWPEPITAPAPTLSGSLAAETLAITRPGLGVIGLLVAAGALAVVVAAVLRRWQPPFGAFAWVFGLNAACLAVLRDRFEWLAVALAVGLATDGFVARLRPLPRHGGAWTAVLALSPALTCALVFVVLRWQDKLSWPPTLWGGSVLLCAVVGAVVAWLTAPVAAPQRV